MSGSHHPKMAFPPSWQLGSVFIILHLAAHLLLILPRITPEILRLFYLPKCGALNMTICLNLQTVCFYFLTMCLLLHLNYTSLGFQTRLLLTPNSVCFPKSSFTCGKVEGRSGRRQLIQGRVGAGSLGQIEAKLAKQNAFINPVLGCQTERQLERQEKSPPECPWLRGLQ